MREVVVSAKTVEEAMQQALTQLNTVQEKCTVEVIDEGKKGFLGFGSKEAIVKVVLLPTEEEKLDEYIQSILDGFNIEITFDRKIEGKEILYTFSGSSVALLIGKRGATLNALQYLVQLAHHTIAPSYKSIVLDAEGYRERRKETLIDLAEKVAQTVRRQKRTVTLDPMPSFERKIIHSIITKSKDLQTQSIGTEPNRYITVSPVKKYKNSR